MKVYFLLTGLFLFGFFHLPARGNEKEQRKDSSAKGILAKDLLTKGTLAKDSLPKDTAAKDTHEEFPGLYRMGIDSAQQFRIRHENDRWILEVIGQGETALIPLGGNRFRPRQVSPPVTLEFMRDSTGRVYKFTWLQDRKGQMTELGRVVSANGTESRSGYTGQYKTKNSLYGVLRVEDEGEGLLAARIDEGAKIEFSSVSKDKFISKKNGYTIWYQFVRNRQGNIQKLLTTEGGILDFIKKTETGPGSSHVSNRENGFTRADSLQGMLTPLRTCYDVLFYALDIRVFPETKSIAGNTTIRFKAMQSFDKMQLDLYANMKIEKIRYHDRALVFTREFNAVFIELPAPIEKGKEDALTIFYSGKPQTPDVSTLKGGFIWYHDKKGNPWIESVCQGSGASLWWPCKDHLSDKPDSMRISVEVPTGLKDISNGRLQKETILPDGFTRYDWLVSYPINNYDAVVNIGNYTRSSDTYTRRPGDTMELNYYCLADDREKAGRIFKQVHPMLDLYEKDFGRYPFSLDGFTLMESLYPMEHQGAISFGSVYNPVNSDKTDMADLARTAWHESAHEWWGNSVTCKDYADFWIHEAFATYAEVLAYDAFSGRSASLKYLKEQHPDNSEPIIGVYNVNNFRMGDMYPKGCLMLNTLRNVIDDDSTWFSILRGIQDRFRYQTVTTEDIVGYFNQSAKKDYTAFFDQYLRHAAIPELALVIEKAGGDLRVRYKWNADVKGFDMPVKLITAKNRFSWIHPTGEWQTISLQNRRPTDFKVDTDDFYIRVKTQ